MTDADAKAVMKRAAVRHAFTYKVFTNVGHGGLITEHTEQFIEEVKAVYAVSQEEESK